MAFRKPLKQAMLQRTRTAPAARAALALAVVLAVGAAFGLHPEPSSAPAASRSAIAVPAPPVSPHGFVACLTHGLAIPAPLSIALAAPAALERPFVSSELSPAAASPAEIVRADPLPRSPRSSEGGRAMARNSSQLKREVI